LSGWQWLFILESIPSLLLGVITLFYLDDRIAGVKWLSPDEKRVIIENIGREESGKEDSSPSHVFKNDKF
jgi:hypothetical protein